MSFKFKLGDTVVIKDLDRANKFWQKYACLSNCVIPNDSLESSFKITQMTMDGQYGHLYSTVGYGWIEEDNLRLKKDREDKKKYRKILIMQEESPFDNVIKARDVYSGEEAEAVCAPSDTFDFATCGKIAFDRLMEKQEKEKLLNCKVVCVKSAGFLAFDVGKVYRVVNGELRSNNRSTLTNLHSIEELKNRTNMVEFIEYKGEA